MTVNLDLIVEVAVKLIRQIQIEVDEWMKDSPAEALEQLAGSSGKPLLAVDKVAEANTMRRLPRRLGLKRRDINLLGEENLSVHKTAKDLTNETRLVVLMDMIDGTDLLERNLSNWCSAMVFYNPQAKHNKIIAAFVGIPEDGVYYATYKMSKPRKRSFHVDQGQERDVELLDGLSNVKSITEASISFYGQKVENLSVIPEQLNLLKQLIVVNKDCRERKVPLKTRIYNLSGMPVMIKMLQSGYKKIDVVFDAHGQAPHDMVAGAYILSKAGATLSDLSGTPIDLERSLLHPADPAYELKYILASTKELSDEVIAAFRSF